MYIYIYTYAKAESATRIWPILLVLGYDMI